MSNSIDAKKITKTAKEYIGATDSDSKTKIALKIATPYGAITKGGSDIRNTGSRLLKMISSLKVEKKDGIPFSDAVLADDMDREVANANANRLRFVSLVLLCIGVFVLIDCLMFITFGEFMAIFSLPIVFLCFVFAGKYAFFAEALTNGEFPAGSLSAYVFRTRWWLDILMPTKKAT